MDDVYYTSCSKPKANVVCDAWFADASFNGTPFKFLMDSFLQNIITCLAYYYQLTLKRPLIL